MDVSVHHSIRAVDMAEWDRVAGPDRLFNSAAWLRAFEEGGLTHFSPCYFVVRDGAGRMVAHASAYVIATSLVLFAKGVLRRAVDAVQRVWPGFLTPRVLEIACPIGVGNGISVAAGTPFSNIAAPLATAIEQFAAAHGIRMVSLRDFTESALADAAAFEPLGYCRVRNMATMTLAIEWSSFDGYLGAMRGSYRERVRRWLKLAARDGLEARVEPCPRADAGRLARQRKNVHDLATEVQRGVIGAQFFERLADEMGPRIQIIQITKHGADAGHALVIDDGATLRWFSFGREVAGVRDGAYFLAIATIVRMAIDAGKTAIDMGLTTAGPKADFGATAERQWLMLRCRGLLGPIVTRALIRLNPVADPPARTVFRDDRAPS